MPQYRLSQHGLDIVFKLEAEQLGTALGRRFGIDLPPIVRHFPTELPIADVHLDQLDTLFELADDSLLHLECQTEHRRATLLRFFQYDSGLYIAHRRRIHTVVFYGAGIAAAGGARRRRGTIQGAQRLPGAAGRRGDVSAAAGQAGDGRGPGPRGAPGSGLPALDAPRAAGGGGRDGRADAGAAIAGGGAAAGLGVVDRAGQEFPRHAGVGCTSWRG